MCGGLVGRYCNFEKGWGFCFLVNFLHAEDWLGNAAIGREGYECFLAQFVATSGEGGMVWRYCHWKRGLCVLFCSFFATSGGEDWLGLGDTAFRRYSYGCFLAHSLLFPMCETGWDLEILLLEDIVMGAS